MIEIKNLTKKFKNKMAVDHIDFQISSNVIHGLLGPNGSGKTTTIKMIIGALKITDGSITINGHNHNDLNVKKIIGYVPESARFCRNISLRNYLLAMGRLSQLEESVCQSRVKRIIENLNMNEFQNKSPLAFSSGMQKKVMIAQALIHNPEIIILDEPSANLDPMARLDLFNDLKRLQKMNKTIIICSHALQELQGIVDEVSILNYSKLLYSGPVDSSIILTELYCHYVKAKDTNASISLLKGLY